MVTENPKNVLNPTRHLPFRSRSPPGLGKRFRKWATIVDHQTIGSRTSRSEAVQNTYVLTQGASTRHGEIYLVAEESLARIC